MEGELKILTPLKTVQTTQKSNFCVEKLLEAQNMSVYDAKRSALPHKMQGRGRDGKRVRKDESPPAAEKRRAG